MAADTDAATDAQTEITIKDARDQIREGAILTNEPTTAGGSEEREYRTFVEVEEDHYNTPARRSDRIRYELLDGTECYMDDAEVLFLLNNGYTFFGGGN